MMKLAYDLHIHSCLSPCASDDMTPANIVGMAAIKGLDVIAVTDHNSCKNCRAVLEMAKEYGVIAIPGMEINTMEEVHAVCLFQDLESAMEFDAYVYQRLLDFPNNEAIFGFQEIYDENDCCVGKEPKLLISAVDISFDDLVDLVKQYNGTMFPAHIDKNANSLISNLGFVPPDSKFKSIEVKNMAHLNELILKNPYLEGCCILQNSDAHTLEDIHEADYLLEVEEKNITSILKKL